MVAFATNYEPETATVEPKDRVGDFFVDFPDRTGLTGAQTHTVAGENSRCRYDAYLGTSLAQGEKRSVRGDVRWRELQNRDENYLSKSIWDPEGTLTSSEALVSFGEGYWDSVTGTPGKGASQLVYGGLWMIGGFYASTTPQGAVALSYGTAQTLGGFINLIGGIFGGPDFVEAPWFVPGSTDAQLEILQQYFQEEQDPPPGE